VLFNFRDLRVLFNFRDYIPVDLGLSQLEWIEVALTWLEIWLNMAFSRYQFDFTAVLTF